MLDTDDFALDALDARHEGTGHYAATIPDRWCFDGRAFGGFSASLALAAIVRHTGRPVLTSASVSFLEPGDLADVEIQVTTLRAGRTAATARAEIVQAGRPILTATAWLADAWIDPPSNAAVAPFSDWPFVPPAQGAPLDWLVAGWPTLGFAERRGVDYPTSFLSFRDRPPQVALWMRVLEAAPPSPTSPTTDGSPTADPGGDRDDRSGWVSQLADVLHLDAHLFDAPGMITGFGDPDDPSAGGASMLSLDLTIAWQPGAARVPAGAWRLLQARGSVAERGVTSYGSLRAEDGSVIAVATSQGILRR